MSVFNENQIVRQHFQQFFAGHPSNEQIWTLGPAHHDFPELRVIEFAPGPKSGLWHYVTIGAWRACVDPQLEFIIAAPAQDLRHVEQLFMTAWYHGKHHLGVGHTFPMGEPWLPGSNCDHFLVSRPYPFGPDLEICDLPESHVHALWLLPITAAEREFKMKSGLEALEQKFEDCGLMYWEDGRSSVV